MIYPFLLRIKNIVSAVPVTTFFPKTNRADQALNLVASMQICR